LRPKGVQGSIPWRTTKLIDIKMKLNLLLEIKKYIEETEETMESEYGCGYSLSKLIELNRMPDLYFKVLKEIEILNNKG